MSTARLHLRIWLLALAACGLNPDASAVQPSGSLDVGLAWLDDDAWRFGRYSGMDESGSYGVLDIDATWADRWDAGQARYCRIEGQTLGLDARRLGVKAGNRGVWGLRLSHDQQPSRRSGRSASVVRGAGGSVLDLPSSWIPGATTATMSELLPSLVPVEFRQNRRRLALGLDAVFSERWTFDARLSREHRDGLRPYAGVIGATGGNARAVILPEPIDYETRELELSARYGAPRAQIHVRWLASTFDQANAFLTWRNPFAGVSGLAPSASFPTGFGRVALPPENRFHQASLTSAFDLTERTRVVADVALGRMRQNAELPPYTVNPVLAESVVEYLPRSRLDGRIDTTAVHLRATSRAGERLHWTASYRYDDRDNGTPRDVWVYIPGDALEQDAGEAGSRRRFNLPVSYRDQRGRLDLGWRSAAGTRFDAHAELREERRTYAERHRAEEWTLGLAVQRRLTAHAHANLRLSRSDRDGSTYVGNRPFLSTYAPAYTATVPGQWENVPDLRRFNLADRSRDRAALSLVLQPGERWNLTVGGAWTQDDYRRSAIGLTESRARAFTLEAGYAWSANFTGYLFHAREGLGFDQNGHAVRGGANRLIDLANQNRLWSVRQDERVDTLGGGLVWQGAQRRWRTTFDFALSLARTDFDIAAGSDLAAAPLPRLKSRLDMLGLRLERRLREHLDLRIGLRRERYRADDWAVDRVGPDQLASIILPGGEGPDYSINMVSLSLAYRF